MIKSIPTSELVPVCAQILREKMRPIHYRDLAEEAASRIVQNDKFIGSDIAEDLRGKGRGFPGKKAGMFYTGKPYCMIALREWFEPTISPIYPQPVQITFDASLKAATETALRIGYMLNKYNVSETARAYMVARGLLIEQHVRNWFGNVWPYEVTPPDNENDYRKPCDHDFKLTYGMQQKIYKVDVCGPNSMTRQYGKPPKKSPVDFHVCAREESGHVMIDGFVTKANYIEQVKPYQITPISALVCWAWCMFKGISHKVIANSMP